MASGELLENIWQGSDVIRLALSWNHSSGCVEERNWKQSAHLGGCQNNQGLDVGLKREGERGIPQKSFVYPKDCRDPSFPSCGCLAGKVLQKPYEECGALRSRRHLVSL